MAQLKTTNLQNRGNIRFGLYPAPNHYFVAGAFAFVCWLIYQSIFALGTLCPWCMVVWTVTIPLFWAVTLYNLKAGNWAVGGRARTFFATAYGWLPLIALLSYLVVAGLAQFRLDLIDNLF